MALCNEDFLCLTAHGTVLYMQNGTLSHGIYTQIPKESLLYYKLSTNGVSANANVEAVGITSDCLTGKEHVRSRYRLIPAGNGRSVHIDTGWGFLSARPEGGMPIHKGPLQGWEIFSFISISEIELLYFVSDHDWRTISKNHVLRDDIGMLGGFVYKFGYHYIDLKLGPCVINNSYNNGVRINNETRSITVLKNGWDIAEIAEIFRPLIYYTAFGNADVFEQLRISIASAIEFGCYAGDILVITDRSENFVRESIPSNFKGRLIISECAALDYIDFCLARYKIYECEISRLYQPMLYVDTDIIFDSDIRPCLLEIFSGDKICAARETQSLKTADSLGAFLFKQTETDTQDHSGFNAGCLGIPSLAVAEWFLRLVIQVAEHYIAVHGRGALWLADQPVTNYLSVKLFKFDLEPISRVTRVGTDDTAANREARLGMVHFWPYRGQIEKRKALSTFFEKMLASQ